MQIERDAQLRRETINQYLLESISKFETGWKVHEEALLKYELTQAKLTKWEQTQDEAGAAQWVNK